MKNQIFVSKQPTSMPLGFSRLFDKQKIRLLDTKIACRFNLLNNPLSSSAFFAAIQIHKSEFFLLRSQC